jgi:hypothetical protein
MKWLLEGAKSEISGPHTFRNRNMLEQEDDSGKWQLRSKGRHKLRVDMRRTNMLESTRHRPKDFDGGFA